MSAAIRVEYGPRINRGLFGQYRTLADAELSILWALTVADDQYAEGAQTIRMEGPNMIAFIHRYYWPVERRRFYRVDPHDRRRRVRIAVPVIA